MFDIHHELYELLSRSRGVHNCECKTGGLVIQTYEFKSRGKGHTL
jgi:hypothetical protein